MFRREKDEREKLSFDMNGFISLLKVRYLLSPKDEEKKRYDQQLKRKKGDSEVIAEKERERDRCHSDITWI